MTLYKHTFPQLTKMLTNLEGWLSKAERFCAANEIPLPALLDQRLYPNMYDLRGQVQFACSNAALLAGRLADVPPPDPTRGHQSFAQVRQLVADTKAFIAKLDASELDGADERMVGIPLIDGMVIRGDDLAIEFCWPNVYFHLTTAYGILRALGVALGKADFIGPMALRPQS